MRPSTLPRPSSGDAPDSASCLAELEADWQLWLHTLFPDYLSDSGGRPVAFARRHAEFWEWLWAVRRGARPRPFVAVWPRGGAKSTSAELGCVAVAARATRRYVLYVSETQDQADDHVQNVAAMLESPVLEMFYPDLGRRMMGKFGNSKGWRRNRLRTAAGFTVDAIGLDSAARGAKVDDDRPDFLIFDDVDDETDTLALVEKKERLLTRKLLPALAPDAVVLGVQNLVHAESVFARLADGRAEYLIDRIVSGPHKAVAGLAYEQRAGRFVITAGEATWDGQDLDRCQEMVDDFGLSAFLAECQQETDARLGGMYDHIDFRHCTHDEVPDLDRVVCWCDPAVTDTDQSDANGIQIDGLAGDGTIYSLWSWEQRSSPLETLKTAIRAALRFKAECVGVETDQGGDTWESVYREACSALVANGEFPDGTTFPRFESQKAGAGHGPKAHRQSQVLADYEKGRIVHVTGTHTALERALRRFPRTKPLDLCLAGETLITTTTGDVSLRQVRVGDWVWTRSGYRRVVRAGVTNQCAETWRVDFSDGRHLIGTAAHPVWTENRGWVPLIHLTGIDRILVCQSERASSTAAAFTTAIPTLRAEPTGCTTPTARTRSTGSSTAMFTAGLPMAGRSTTLRMSPSASGMTRLISLPTQPRESIALSRTRATAPRSASPIWTRFGRWLLNGTGATTDGRGTGSTHLLHGVFERRLSESALSADRSSSRALPEGRSFSARGSAGMRSASGTHATGKSGGAPSAASPSWRASTAVPSTAGVRVRAVSRHGTATVYNLQVEGEPEYFANGVLVHNCDARYWSWADLRAERPRPIGISFGGAHGGWFNTGGRR